MQQAHEGPVAPLHDGDNLSAPALGRTGLLLRDGYPHDISVQGPPGLGGLYIYIFFLPFNAHESESVPGHEHFSLKFGDNARFLVVLAVGAVFAFGHVVVLYPAKIRKIC